MFNFGVNWQNYSRSSLDKNRFNQAVTDLKTLIGQKNIANKTFLDLGCGSGIHALAASKLGAKQVIGIDISPESIQISKANKKRFAPKSKVKFKVGSVFDLNPANSGEFDIVYSWGVLHHTGDMELAIKKASSLVPKKGLLVLAIYNKHWSSPVWWYIKKIYNFLPDYGQKLMVGIFVGIIALAKFGVTGKNPFTKKRRGMNFYYDVVDWLGGFPYEYASKDRLVKLVESKGFSLTKFVPALVPTGCHEYIFEKQ